MYSKITTRLADLSWRRYGGKKGIRFILIVRKFSGSHAHGQGLRQRVDELTSLQPEIAMSAVSTDHHESIPEGILLGVGNPLLDISIHADQNFLNKYGLLANNAILADNRHMELFEEMVSKYKPAFLPGGATQNSIRVAQWLLQRPQATSFIGAIGNDKFGEILQSQAEAVGVNVCYEMHEGQSTGRCGAVITGEDRSLVSDLAAAKLLRADFLDQPRCLDLIKRARYYYIGGFVVPDHPDAVLKILKHAAESGKVVIMNLHATFACQFFADPDLALMQYIDVLFGNNDEAAEFAKLQGFECADLKNIAIKTAGLPKINKKRDRIVVFTQGRDPTIVVNSGDVSEYPILPVDPNQIIDTNGCGDAFVGGFMSQLVQNKPLSECMRCGFYAAKVVIQHFGCNYPAKPDFE